ncbi:MAG: hypothetical protein Q4B48_06175 [Syntrophomonadaceae bacterium]|nr:hypothetical protein [Syntrophomonadaceae bacterium]
MKKLLALALALMMMFALAACGEENEPATNGSAGEPAVTGQDAEQPDTPEPADEGNTEVGKSKTAKFFSQLSGDEYTMEMSVSDPELGSYTTISAMKDDMIYSSIEGDYSSITIIRDGYMYTFDPASMTSMKMPMTEQQTEMLEVDDLISGEGEYATFTEGSMEIDGKKYDYEDFGGERFCFDGKDVVYMVYMEGDEIVSQVKLVSVSNKADKKLFELPEGYTEMDMTSMMEGLGDFNLEDFGY